MCRERDLLENDLQRSVANGPVASPSYISTSLRPLISHKNYPVSLVLQLSLLLLDFQYYKSFHDIYVATSKMIHEVLWICIYLYTRLWGLLSPCPLCDYVL